MREIFLSYRRDDSGGYATSLFKDLTETFGADAVFMDVADIEPGRDFRKVIDANTGACRVLLALIGKDWLDARDEAGRRRLDDPMDFVRLETSSALRRDIPVVPVLVQGAHMPRPDQLPPDLQDLPFRNAVELTHARWGSDVKALIGELAPLVKRADAHTSAQATPPAPPAQPPAVRRGLPAWGLAAIGAIAVGAVAVAYLGQRAAAPSGRPSGRPSTQPVDSPVARPCLSGLVWREATRGDFVCVTPEVRSLTIKENNLAGSRLEPGGGAFGPDSCRQGYVWREATPVDHVCVPPEVRTRTANENARASSRVAPAP